jgi:uncharacterized RDD family membrane protein YckC
MTSSQVAWCCGRHKIKSHAKGNELNCPKCGVDVADDATSCAACGEPIENDSTLGAGAPSARIEAKRVVYAGFWLRVVAYSIDSLLLGVVVGIVLLRPLMEHAGISSDNPWVLFNGDSRQVVAINLMVMMAGWLYWAVLESSSWQATLGKKALGLKVTDLQGHRISLARASARHFGKIIFVGFILAGFTAKKQALHDMLAGCLVLRNI